MNAPRPTLRQVRVAAYCGLAVGALVLPGGSVVNNARAEADGVTADVRALPGTIASVPFRMGSDVRALAKAAASVPKELGG